MLTLKRSVVFGSVFGSIVFAVAFLGGYAITAAFGPGTSGVITATLTSAIVVVGGMLVPRFPTLLVVNTVFALLAIPTLLFGPFGPLKFIFGIGTGLIYEITTFAMKRTSMSYIVAAGVSAFLSVYLIYFGSIWLVGAPSPTLAKYRDYFAVAYAILGALGGFIGTRVFILIQRNTSPTVEAPTK